MKYPLFFLFILLATSCKYFETAKITTEVFYEEELKTIDWKDVDQYPAFSNCENLSDKLAQLSCFENNLSEHLGRTFGNHNAVAIRDINDTIQLEFSINNSGKLNVISIKSDSILNLEFPLLESWFREGIDTLKSISPALKRGIPVATQFTLPIVITTKTTN